MSSYLRPLKKIVCIAVFSAGLIFSSHVSYAQLGGVGDIFGAGVDGIEDAQLLLKEYVRPFGSGFGAGLNSGWVDRSGTHGVFGFHVKVSVSASLVPSSDRSFDISNLDLQALQLHNPAASSIAPTFSGDSDPGPRMVYYKEGIELANFQMPEGIGLRIVPSPMIQAGIGLPKNTDVMIRFIPAINNSDFGKMYLYGFGFKHELNQWIPGGTFFPVTFSITAGLTSFNSKSDLSAVPTDYENASDPHGHGGPSSETWENQELSLSTNAFSMNLLVGRSLPILSVYAGVGFERSSTAISVDGAYPYYSLNDANQRQLEALTDPVDFSIDGSNKIRALAGLRISLPLLTFNVDYTYSNYSIITAAVGISFR